MRITTLNTNGIRAAARKGFFTWLMANQADVVCIQETKAQVAQLTDSVFTPNGYHSFYHSASKKGYSGTALYSRRQPSKIITDSGCATFDDEGRYLEAVFGKLHIVSLYMPSGSAKEERQQVKYDCMDYLLDKMYQMQDGGDDWIICGDWNIAHQERDLRNWRGNRKNSGFLPEERAWLDVVFTELGFVDAFRQLQHSPHQYTWWSNRGNAWANNVGWRIDYQIVSPSLANKVATCAIYKQQRFSDHAPLTIDYDYPFYPLNSPV